MSKNQQNKLFIGCVYAEVNHRIQCFGYVMCFSRDTFHPYVPFQALHIPPPKKTSKEVYYDVKGCI